MIAPETPEGRRFLEAMHTRAVRPWTKAAPVKAMGPCDCGCCPAEVIIGGQWTMMSRAEVEHVILLLRAAADQLWGTAS